jgi:hypothetical protein
VKNTKIKMMMMVIIIIIMENPPKYWEDWIHVG